MSQLVIKPWASLPLPGGHRGVFDDAARHLRQQGHRMVAGVLAVAGRVRRMQTTRLQPYPRLESAYLEAARMSREMYRL